MKLTIRAGSTEQVLKAIITEAQRQANSQDANAAMQTTQRDKRDAQVRAATLRVFADFLSDITIEAPAPGFAIRKVNGHSIEIPNDQGFSVIEDRQGPGAYDWVIWGPHIVARVDPNKTIGGKTAGDIAMALTATPLMDAALRAIISLSRGEGAFANVGLIGRLAESVITTVESKAPEIPPSPDSEQVDETPHYDGLSERPLEFSEAEVGSLIRHVDGGLSFVVTGNFGDRLTAVRSIDVTNPPEWVALAPIKRANETPVSSYKACTKTEACALEDGHAGECDPIPF